MKQSQSHINNEQVKHFYALITNELKDFDESSLGLLLTRHIETCARSGALAHDLQQAKNGKLIIRNTLTFKLFQVCFLDFLEGQSTAKNNVCKYKNNNNLHNNTCTHVHQEGQGRGV